MILHRRKSLSYQATLVRAIAVINLLTLGDVHYRRVPT